MKQLFSQKRTSGRIAVNLIGNVAPLLAGLLSIPFVIEQMGVERFGLVTIAWLFLGYFGFLDLGIGRATTKFVVEYESNGKDDQVESLIFSATFTLLCVGTVIGIGMFVFTPTIVDNFNVPGFLRSEATATFHLVALSIPFVTSVSSLRGVLEARHQFLLLNVIKMPSGILNYLIPACVVLVSNNLVYTIAGLLINRILLFFVYLFFCFKKLDSILGEKLFDVSVVKKMVTYGGWMTLSNIIGPIMVYFDRFIVGSFLTLAALSFYTTPYEMITKLLLFAASTTTVLFPIFVDTFINDRSKLEKIYRQGIRATAVILFPITFLIIFFSRDILTVWLGGVFAQNSTLVMQFLTLGVFINSIAAIPFTCLQATGRPDIAARAHLVELPAYVALLIVLAKNFGIAGVAGAWTIRNLIDLGILYHFNSKHIGRVNDSSFFFFISLSTAGSFFISLYFSDSEIAVRILSYLILIVLFSSVVWARFFSKEDRESTRILFSIK